MTRFFVTKGGNKMEEFKYLIPEESIDAIITNVSKLREIENSLTLHYSYSLQRITIMKC